MDLADAEARARGAVDAALEAVGDRATTTPVESTGRQRCEEGYTLKFKGRYQTALSFEARTPDPAGLDEVAAAIEARWLADGWDVSSKRLDDSPTRELSAQDDGFLVNALFYPDPAGGSLSVGAVTPCATPPDGG